MQNGWIKLHRKLKDKGYYRKSHYVHIWVHLLLGANHEQKEFMWNGQIVMVKTGQLITGRKELSEQTGIPESTVEDILKLLEREHQIQQHKTPKFRLITIVKWGEYQNSDSKSNNRATTGRHKQELKELKENIYTRKEEVKQRVDIKKFKPDFLKKPNEA